MTRLVLAAALLVGCAPRPASPLELGAVSDLRDAWHAAGRSVPECRWLDQLRVMPMPDAAVQDRCGATYLSEATGTRHRVASCVIVGQFVTEVPVPDNMPPYAVRNAVIHEGAHVLRLCEWEASGRRLDVLERGETEGCDITHPMDHRHCDAEVWRQIVPAAQH